MQRHGFTPVPLAFLGFVLVAAVLLLVGYGVPVGVGLLVGLVLGCAVGVMGVLWLGAGPGRTIGAGGVTFYSSETHGPVELPDWVRDGERAMGVDLSPLQRIVVVAESVESAGVRVELTTIELRETGGLAFAVVHTAPPDARPVGPFARVSVADDVGTAYAAGSQATGGAPFVVRHDIRFAPAPPAVATRLLVRIEEFANPFPGQGPQQLVGPWEFTVPLEPAGNRES